MKTHLTLSEKSKTFLEELRNYLSSTGKKADEVETIIFEVEGHLLKAEISGASIENIIGSSPKDFMKKYSKEISKGHRLWTEYAFLIVVGAFAIIIFRDWFNGFLSYSILEILSFLGISLIFILSMVKGFRYIAARHLPSWKQIAIILPITIVPILLFAVLMYLNHSVVETTFVQFSPEQTRLIGILTILIVVIMSIWAKTWLLIVVVALTTLPGELLKATTFPDQTQALLNTVITFGGIALYFIFASNYEKRKAKKA